MAIPTIASTVVFSKNVSDLISLSQKGSIEAGSPLDVQLRALRGSITAIPTGYNWISRIITNLTPISSAATGAGIVAFAVETARAAADELRANIPTAVVLHHIASLFEAKETEAALELFESLPEDLRGAVFGKIWELKGRPDYHEFGSISFYARDNLDATLSNGRFVNSSNVERAQALRTFLSPETILSSMISEAAAGNHEACMQLMGILPETIKDQILGYLLSDRSAATSGVTQSILTRVLASLRGEAPVLVARAPAPAPVVAPRPNVAVPAPAPAPAPVVAPVPAPAPAPAPVVAPVPAPAPAPAPVVASVPAPAPRVIDAERPAGGAGSLAAARVRVTELLTTPIDFRGMSQEKIVQAILVDRELSYFLNRGDDLFTGLTTYEVDRVVWTLHDMLKSVNTCMTENPQVAPYLTSKLPALKKLYIQSLSMQARLNFENDRVVIGKMPHAAMVKQRIDLHRSNLEYIVENILEAYPEFSTEIQDLITTDMEKIENLTKRLRELGGESAITPNDKLKAEYLLLLTEAETFLRPEVQGRMSSLPSYERDPITLRLVEGFIYSLRYKIREFKAAARSDLPCGTFEELFKQSNRLIALSLDGTYQNDLHISESLKSSTLPHEVKEALIRSRIALTESNAETCKYYARNPEGSTDEAFTRFLSELSPRCRRAFGKS